VRNQVSGESREAIVVTLRPAEFDPYVTLFDETGFVQTCAQRRNEAYRILL
jgi:hypothetical protein